MNLTGKSTKEIGDLGEAIAIKHLQSNNFSIVGRNIVRKTGEIDIIARKEDVLHFVEVKTVLRKKLPHVESLQDDYEPSVNLHLYKIQKVIRTAMWYMAEKGWEGEWQVDGVLVWFSANDGSSRIEYLPQIA